MGMQGQFCARVGQVVEHGHGGFHFVANAAHIQQQYRGAFFQQGSAKLSDHGFIRVVCV